MSWFASSDHLCVANSNSRSFVAVKTELAMYLPLGEHRGKYKPSDCGTVTSLFAFMSRMCAFDCDNSPSRNMTEFAPHQWIEAELKFLPFAISPGEISWGVPPSVPAT